MKAVASAPPTWTSPMWDRSKRPMALRTVRCSSMIDAYCTGISQPAKGIIRAPSSTWTAWSGVRRSVSSAPEVISRASTCRPSSAPPGGGRGRSLAGEHGGRRAEPLPLGGVAEQLDRLFQLEPGGLVELGVVVHRVAADGAHEVEVDGLVEAHPGSDEEVADRLDRRLDLDLDARLLARLAQSGLLQRLAGRWRALGQSPERRRAAMEEDDLQAISDAPVDDAARGGRARRAQRGHAARVRSGGAPGRA